jgi:hypothetical protein
MNEDGIISEVKDLTSTSLKTLMRLGNKAGSEMLERLNPKDAPKVLVAAFNSSI